MVTKIASVGSPGLVGSLGWRERSSSSPISRKGGSVFGCLVDCTFFRF